MKIDDLNADNSTKIYLDKINMLLDTYAPLKRINKYKLKFKSKPLIRKGACTLKEEIHTKKNTEIYSLPLWRKVNRLIRLNILKEIGIILRTRGKESNPLFL